MPDWQQGLFGCFSNFKVVLWTGCCPCVVFGRTAEKMDESCKLHALAYLVPILNYVCMAQIRTKIRESKAIDGSFGGDLLCVLCCGACAMCQMANEVGAMGMAQSMARE